MEKIALCKGRCTNVWKGSEVAEQVLVMTAWAVQSLHEQWTMLNELMLWFKRTDGLLSLIQVTSWTSVDLHIPASKRTSDITKFVQDGCQSSLQISTNRYTWKCACNFCSNIMKEAFLQWVKHECNTESACKHQSMESKNITTQDQKIQKYAFCWQSDIDTVLGL